MDLSKNELAFTSYLALLTRSLHFFTFFFSSGFEILIPEYDLSNSFFHTLTHALSGKQQVIFCERARTFLSRLIAHVFVVSICYPKSEETFPVSAKWYLPLKQKYKYMYSQTRAREILKNK